MCSSDLVAAARTAIGTFGGTLKDTPLADLATLAVKEALARSGAPADAVGHLAMGTVVPTDYALNAYEAHTAGLVNRWQASAGALDANRDLIADFQSAGFRYAATRGDLDAIDAAKTDKLLGLFAHSNMNVALDKINGRRGVKGGVNGGTVVDDFGLPDQPMLDEMTTTALAVLERQKNGFFLMVEGA